MALSASEFLSAGKVVDPDGRRVIVIGTRNVASSGERLSGGRTVDADGREIVVRVGS